MATGLVSAAAVVAAVGAEIDPTVEPTRGSFWAFLFLAVALVLLLVSMSKHLSRARENLAPTRSESTGYDTVEPTRPRNRTAGDDAAGADRS